MILTERQQEEWINYKGEHISLMVLGIAGMCNKDYNEIGRFFNGSVDLSGEVTNKIYEFLERPEELIFLYNNQIAKS